MMKAIRWLLIILVLLILLPWTIRADGVLPLGDPEWSFLYDRLERQDALTLDRADYQLGPYGLTLAAETLGPFGWMAQMQPRDLRLVGKFGETFRGQKQATALAYESLHGAVAAQPLRQVFVYGSFRLDEALAKDQSYTGKKWRGLAGDIDNAFVHVRTGELSLMVGRFASFWGPRRSLVLGDNVSMDGMGYSYRWGRLVLSYRLARLDGLDPDVDSVGQFENRYFAAHRLDWHVSDRVRVGLFESAIFGGPGRQIELYYLNPILFYHASQLNDGVDDNTFLGFDLSFQPVRGVRLYGQLVVDDYQIDDESQGDQEPNEIALLAGTYAADIAAGCDVRAEYTRVTNRTFNQSHPRNRYTYKGELIGAADGNDYDLLDLRVFRWFSPLLRGAVQLSYRRQGEGRVTAAWDTPWLETEGAFDEPFPTGTVERTATTAASFTGLLFDHVFVDATAGVEWVRNRGHVDGSDRTAPFVQIRVTSFVSSVLSVD